MTLNDKAQEFLKRFLYKKQIKFTLSLLLYSLGLFLGLLPFSNPLHLKIISAVCVIYNIIALLVETKFIKSLNSFTYVKYDILYIFNSIVFLVMPYSSFTIVGLFIIPFSLFFINLAEHSFGLDNLHWPYCFNLVYNCVVLLILILLKESIPVFKNVALDQYSDMFFKSFTLATAAGEISTELVDIRFLFKAKTYKESGDSIGDCFKIVKKKKNDLLQNNCKPMPDSPLRSFHEQSAIKKRRKHLQDSAI